jgi:hypothetical protein
MSTHTPKHNPAIYCGKPVRQYMGRFPFVLSKETGAVEIAAQIKKYPTCESEERKEDSVEFK